MPRERFGDDELDAMRKCAMTLTQLDDDATRQRVLRYLCDRFYPLLPLTAAAPLARFGGNTEDQTHNDVTLATGAVGDS